ncbi:hypothetical protein [Saccharothrix australiensis]|uniref:hypothetical protein n=1 Tax=Saccharothrix australiensis TaxID=2072 RepID=UPI001476A76E|nr:hypothetical protein [Saccharothrix australiensis]
MTPEEDAAARWIEAASRPVRELDKIEMGSLLRSLGRNLDGEPAADCRLDGLGEERSTT